MVTTDDESQGSENEVDPRVRIVNTESGEFRFARRSDLVGLDDFVSSWQNDVEQPHQLSFSGWQMADDDHPTEGGRPGYRIVFKTIRMVPFPALTMEFANMRVFLGNGPVVRGEPVFESAIPGRGRGSFLVPEWGPIELSDDGKFGYRYVPNWTVDIHAKQETLPVGNYLELLYFLPEGTPADFAAMQAAGRAGTASLLATLDLQFGHRLIGPLLSEEVGAIFDDWHWNRLLGGRAVAIESQAEMRHLDAAFFAERLGDLADRHIDSSDEHRNRVKVASQWYWRADSENEPVQRFISYWLCIEALELGQNANIAPIKRVLAEILMQPITGIAGRLGRLYGMRSALVHGERADVPPEDAETVKVVAIALLERRLAGQVSKAHIADLRRALGWT